MSNIENSRSPDENADYWRGHAEGKKHAEESAFNGPVELLQVVRSSGGTQFGMGFEDGWNSVREDPKRKP